MLTYAEILKLKEEHPDDFQFKVECGDCPCYNTCANSFCREALNNWLEAHTENNVDNNKKLYVIDNGIERYVVELTTEQEKFLKWLDEHSFLDESPKEYTEPEVYKI